MKTRSASVHLHGILVGSLREDEQGYVEFRIDPDYAALSNRPVLGQWFEDRPRGTQRGEHPQELPAFFENIIPEGDLGLLLRERLAVDPADDLGLLLAVGKDLPGAVVVLPSDDEGADREALGDQRDAPALNAQDVNSAIRFSLAGVQLKFSMIRQGQRFFFPGKDARGDWIAKIALAPYGDVCRNEYVTMTWARHCGFDVPDCELRVLGDLVGVPHDAPEDSRVFVIRRFDRDAVRRIHQEDFQQIVGRRPHKKYSDITYEQLVLVAMKVVGDDVYEEMVRRLVFVIASGNDDAHLKNWSVLYPDTIRPRLTPLYDQVFTGQWPDFNTTLALKLGGTKMFAAVELARFRELARRVGADPRSTEQIVEQAIDGAATSWQLIRDIPELGSEYRTRIYEHWKKVPLLAPHAERLG